MELISLTGWPLGPIDLTKLVCSLTDEDCYEFNLMDPSRNMVEVLTVALGDADECWLGVDEAGNWLALGGWQGDSVWFITTKAVDSLSNRGKAKFIKALKDNRDYVLKKHGGPVGNVIWEGATRHRGFLKALGATFHDWWHVSEATGERFQFFTVGN